MEFDVIIEIPKGQRNKYEMDHETVDPAGPDAVYRYPLSGPIMASSSTRSPTTATRSMLL